jgi:hypothetical protein
MMTVKELRDNLNQLVNRHYETSEMARFYSFPMTVGYVRREIFIKNPRQQELSVPDQDVPSAEAQRERLASVVSLTLLYNSVRPELVEGLSIFNNLRSWFDKLTTIDE